MKIEKHPETAQATTLNAIFIYRQEWRGLVFVQTLVLAFSIDKNFLRFSHPSIPGMEKETTFQMEIFLINVTFPQKKGNLDLIFRDSPMCSFLKK